MTTETDLFDALKSLVGNRVAPIVFPQPPAVPTWPAIRYSFPSVNPVVDLCGDGDDTTAEVRVQLDAVATTYSAARQLRLDIMAIMRTFDPPAILEFSTSDYDSTTKVYIEIMQYTLHGSSA